MIAREPRRRRTAGLSCEPLEDRALLSSLGGSGRPLGAPALFIEPQAGRAPIIRAIDSARTTIRLGICNLSDPQIGDALAAAAARGVDVKVIVDQADYHAKPEEQAEIASLLARNVSVHLSNPVFPQSFEKELVIDRRQALIMTMCLVPATFEDTRDYGLVVSSPGIVREVASVFDTDWAFSAAPGEPTPEYNPTPPLHVSALIWGPTDATARISRLIQSARRSIDVTTELLDDPYLEGQLIAAAHRGVKVRMITPTNPRGAAANGPQIAFLTRQGVDVRVTTQQSPPPNAMPYMHAKTMLIDGRTAYLGSIDLETTEATQDRELGVVFRQRPLVHRLNAQFQADWNATGLPPA